MPKRLSRVFRIYHRLYKITGGYHFLRQNLVKLGLSIVGVLAAFYVFDYFLDLDGSIGWLAKTLHPAGLIGLFFLSETTVGLITPEILIIWADETLKPRWMLVLLSLLSYGSGLLAYYLGTQLSRMPAVHSFLLEKHAETMAQLKRFGALLIVLGALTPLPYPIICQLSGLTKFPFKTFALITTIRFLRFAIYGFLLYNIF